MVASRNLPYRDALGNSRLRVNSTLSLSWRGPSSATGGGLFCCANLQVGLAPQTYLVWEGYMPIRRKAEEAGVFNPSEVALLGRVFDRLKFEGQSEHQREALASRIIANFEAGISDEDELASASKLPLGR